MFPSVGLMKSDLLLNIDCVFNISRLLSMGIIDEVCGFKPVNLAVVILLFFTFFVFGVLFFIFPLQPHQISGEAKGREEKWEQR